MGESMKKDEAVPPEPAARSVLTARLHCGVSPGTERTPAAAAPRPAVSEGVREGAGPNRPAGRRGLTRRTRPHPLPRPLASQRGSGKAYAARPAQATPLEAPPWGGRNSSHPR